MPETLTRQTYLDDVDTNPTPTDIKESGIESSSGFGLHIRQHVGVGIEGLRYLGVAEHLLDDARVHTLLERESSCGVPEIVEAKTVKTDLAGEPVGRKSPDFLLATGWTGPARTSWRCAGQRDGWWRTSVPRAQPGRPSSW